jgi:hypothetical protein
MEEVRAAKTQIVALLKSRDNFKGVGIGESGGELVLRVNWSELPKGVALPDRIGRVRVEHHEVGTPRAHGE